ncbi:transcription termination/antitermination protein NusG [uncultured Fretibacterium sp.]|uniref:transcription termination/antitermination protein NusG n=1 Tax=uncultured Fretibacterium sp. TaxID=1678694 RepID=UPI002621068F|nr:transcription termination/antitermination protein NusG [uncultured Fretibacterium sp.]
MEVRDERRWYVVQTYAGYENRVKANLDQRIETMGMEKNIFNVLVPVEERVLVKDGKSRKVSRKLYPSYVLVEMVLDEQSWYVVRHTPGVTGFVGAGSLPLPLSEREVRELMSRIGSEQAKPKVEINLRLGDTVSVRSGPFEGQAGPVVEIIPEKGKVKFTVSVFGRETVVETDYELLEKI